MRGRRTAQRIGIEPSARFTPPGTSPGAHRREIDPQNGVPDDVPASADYVPPMATVPCPVDCAERHLHFIPQLRYTPPSELRETPRYTLDEARALLAREDCDRDGHDLETLLLRSPAPSGRVIHRVRCSRCGATFTETSR